VRDDFVEKQIEPIITLGDHLKYVSGELYLRDLLLLPYCRYVILHTTPDANVVVITVLAIRLSTRKCVSTTVVLPTGVFDVLTNRKRISGCRFRDRPPLGAHRFRACARVKVAQRRRPSSGIRVFCRATTGRAIIHKIRELPAPRTHSRYFFRPYIRHEYNLFIRSCKCHRRYVRTISYIYIFDGTHL